MIKKYRTIREFYIFNLSLFIGFSFEFFVRGDNFLGAVMFFNGLMNFIAYFQVPRRVASITIFLNLFNFMISVTASYNYSDEGDSILFVLWGLLSAVYLFAALRQVYSILANKASRKKIKKRKS